MKKEHKSCPSSTCEDGAILLGVVNEDGTVGYISTPVTREIGSFWIPLCHLSHASTIEPPADNRYVQHICRSNFISHAGSRVVGNF